MAIAHNPDSPPDFPARSVSHPPAIFAGFSSWLLDAFDFFLVTFTLTSIAKEFHRSDAEMALVITMTMICRPIGGFLFGLLADRYGRKIPLMVNMSAYAVSGILTGFAPNFTALLVIRAVFGIVMGGTWGVGTSLAMEGAPARHRGLLSGLLQEGYAAGNVLAAMLFFFFHGIGWRWLFILSSIPSIPLVFYIGIWVRESDVWKQIAAAAPKPSWGEQFTEIARHWKLFLYLLAFMTLMMFTSHGTQDMYPTFLQRDWKLAAPTIAAITAISQVGAILGGVAMGYFSDRKGRRFAIVTAFALGIVVIPLWAFAPNVWLLGVGAFLIQFMVQGAWGVIPAHLAELSPNSVRALLPGFAYQAGGVIASTAPFLEALYAKKTGYAVAMALTALVVFIFAGIMAALGRERRGEQFQKQGMGDRE